ncbi:NUDIX domain-containing protein [Mucilaginibacter pallidiroseus]|uniref:NUDIX domain-containing protein n=1 Tax=Mucilaginibacter pallidiroseus TaxID=2599295 RepID=A0A563UIE6_9SPHI|nr:NUDIX domain-containing protein [Mucilaginibacter pallidiroseus]TWR31135.1 NUDIX domain-containing protein [Mucilaginibacter pallidiroseus]
MAQKYRIYINEKVVFITSDYPADTKKEQIIEDEGFDLKLIYYWTAKQKADCFYVVTTDPKALLKQIRKSVTVIDAAGGLVKNTDSKYLFIFRNGKWDLPKGKIEKKEKNKVAAVREVEEECGIKVNKLEEKLCKTYHTYVYKGEVVLKRSHWYSMRYKGKAKLVPQLEEGITDVRWFGKEEIPALVTNTFPSIIDVLEKAGVIEEKVWPLLG